MAKDIKNLKPNKNSRYKQGYYTPSDKYVGTAAEDKVVIYRSSLELKFCNLCDNSPKIVQWSSETLAIPYEFENTIHTYWPDYLMKTSTGQIYVVEVKPYHQTQVPSKYASHEAKYTYMKNVAKWKAAVDYCARHNMKFKIITERFFNV